MSKEKNNKFFIYLIIGIIFMLQGCNASRIKFNFAWPDNSKGYINYHFLSSMEGEKHGAIIIRNPKINFEINKNNSNYLFKIMNQPLNTVTIVGNNNPKVEILSKIDS